MTIAAMSDAQKIRDRSEHRIRELIKDWASNTIEIGLHLAEVRETFEIGPHGQRMGFKKWLRVIGISNDHAVNLIAIAKKFGHLHNKQTLPTASVLKFLARATTPTAATKDVLRRTKRGELITTRHAEQIANRHRPKPKEAQKLAKEKGKPVLASDGYLYTGTSKEQAKEGEKRRTLAYAVLRAVKVLSEIELTPHQFLMFVRPYQLWNKIEERQIGGALKWLNALNAAWETKQ